MRRFVLFLALCLLGLVPLCGQKLGFVVGPSMHYGVLSGLDEGAYARIVPNGGFHVGMQFEYDVTNRWGFDVQGLYEFRNIRWRLGYPSAGSVERIMDRQIGYLNVPFHFYVNFPLKNKVVVNLFGGPVFACGLHAHDWAYENTDLRKPVNEFARPETSDEKSIFAKEYGRILRCEAALEVGLAVKYRNFQGRIGYQHSLTNDTYNKFFYTLPLANAPYMTQGEVKLSFVYLFDLRK